MPYGAACPWETASLLLLQEQQVGFGRGWHLEKKCGAFSFAGVVGVRVSIESGEGKLLPFFSGARSRHPKGILGS